MLYRRAEKELFNWNFKVADSMLNEYSRQIGENFLSDFLNLMLGRYDEVIESMDNQIREDPNALYNKIETV